MFAGKSSRRYVTEDKLRTEAKVDKTDSCASISRFGNSDVNLRMFFSTAEDEGKPECKVLQQYQPSLHLHGRGCASALPQGIEGGGTSR